MSVKKRFSAILEFIFELELRIAMLALVAMMLVVVADVFMRYVFNAPIRGSFDLVEIFLAVMVFFGMAGVIRRGQELVIDLIDGLLSARVIRRLVAVASALSAIVLSFIFWSMLGPAKDAYNYGDLRLELNLPVWIIWVLTLVGLSGGVLASLAVLLLPDTQNAQAKTYEKEMME